MSMIFPWDYYGISSGFLKDFHDISMKISMGFLLDSYKVSMIFL